MTEVTAISAQTASLLLHYGFDLGGKKAEKLANQWLIEYPGYWLRLAVIEALYQGRYKAVSVEQILSMWQRLGQPLYHFNGEFERLVCSNFPQDLTTIENDAKQSPEKIFLPTSESDIIVPEIDSLPPQPETEIDGEQDVAVPEIESEEIEKVPAVDGTKETAEVVIYEDLAVTAVADKAETNRELVAESVEQSTLIVKHTDFHSKLKAIATEGKRKKGERRKKV
jgi:hypothetical protein